jgi:Fe-S oxidoreductase
MMKIDKNMKRLKIRDISKNSDKQLVDINAVDLLQLPPMCTGWNDESAIKELTQEQKNKYECSLDGVSAVGLPKPQSREEEEKLIESFLNGLKKLFTREDNWTFLQPLVLSLENCVNCQTCSEACPIYLASGKQEIYRPTYRSEVLRRIINKYLNKSFNIFDKLSGNDIELNWATIARLAESVYRCTLCRRCAQACPMSVDNGLITHELRKLFSQEMGIAPKEIHESGTVLQLKTGSSTGTGPKAFKSFIQFMESEIEEKLSRKINIPVDKQGADILLIHNSGEFISWMENPEAFAIIFESGGLDWTLSSELYGSEATNYGLWYDDVQLARIALKQVEVARKLGVKKIVIGECGHAHKALAVVADRIFNKENNIHRESYLPIVEDLVVSGRLKLDPSKNNFPVTLHDPCNMVRLMGIVNPQREILKRICPQFMEMTPHGTDNYCCGGGSGFAIMNSMNFPDWRINIAGRMKLKQILDVFKDVINPDIKKYVCAPCSNCKGQFRSLFDHYKIWEKCGITYGGLVELVVNAMIEIKQPYINWPDSLSM